MNARSFLRQYAAKRSEAVPEAQRTRFLPDDQLELRLSGPGGGTFRLFWENGALETRSGAAEKPLVRMSTVATQFLDLLTGKLHPALDVTGPEASKLLFDPATFLLPKNAGVLRKVEGTICIQCCSGYIPNANVLTESHTSFCGKDLDFEAPRCKVLLPLEQMARVARGEVKAPQLMMSGNMRVVGDIQMVIQLAPVLQ